MNENEEREEYLRALGEGLTTGSQEQAVQEAQGKLRAKLRTTAPYASSLERAAPSQDVPATGGHTRWITTRQRLADNPEALAAYNAERKRLLEEEDEDTPDPPQAVWRIFSTVNNKWYMPDARGYTERIEKSGRFTPGEAFAIYGDAARGWDPYSNPFKIDIVLVPA